MTAILLSLALAQCGPQGCPAPTYQQPLTPVTITLPALQSVVRVKMPDAGQPTISCGSGSLIDSDLVVTNWHVVRDGNGRGTVTFRTGQTATAGVLDSDQANDLAVLKLDSLASELPIEFSDGAPNRGQRLIIAGYGQSGQLLPQVGRLGSFGRYVVLSGCQSRQGDSGGPILDTSGRLCGVLWGARSGETWGTPCGPLRRLLERIRARRIGVTPSPIRRGPGTAQPAQSPAAQPVRTPPSDENQSPSLQPREAAPLDPRWPAPVVTAPAERVGQPPAVAPVPKQNPPGDSIAGPLASQPAMTQPAAGGFLLFLADAARIAAPAILGGVPGGVGALLAGWAAKRAVAKLLANGLPKLNAATGLLASAGQIGGAAVVAAPPNPYQSPQSLPPQWVVQSNTPQAPTFVPTQVADPEFTALKKALETLGQNPQDARWVNKVYGLAKQLFNQVK